MAKIDKDEYLDPTIPLLEVRDLAVSFGNPSSPSSPRVQAVAGVNMTIYPRQTLAVVGESGCGKSVTAMSTMQLVPRPPGRFDGGKALFRGDDVLEFNERQIRSLRGDDIAMIFQEPMTSLNPVYTIGDQIMEAILLHQKVSGSEAERIAVEAMRDVGIPQPEQRLKSYPHQFSGGMRQRVMIAMALITRPEVLISDEPTTALDVTVQAQILDILQKRRAELGTSIIFITHDLGVVSGFCDRVHVMYAGKTLESAPTRKLFEQSKHPYTQALQSSIPALHDKETALYTIPGSPPDLSNPPRGCPFAPRCEHAIPACSSDETPMELKPIGEEHFSACIRYQQGDLS